jgi:hypothetical protein
MKSDRFKWAGWPIVVHSLRTAIAAVASLLLARVFRLPQAYWAPITTLVVTQSSFGAALTVSRARFFGTALGAVVGGIVATYLGSNVLVFGIGVFLRRHHADNCAPDPAHGPGMANRPPPFRRSLHRNFRGSDIRMVMAGGTHTRKVNELLHL